MSDAAGSEADGSRNQMTGGKTDGVRRARCWRDRRGDAREHATPGGINEQFLNDLEQGRLYEDVSLGLQRVLDRLDANR